MRIRSRRLFLLLGVLVAVFLVLVVAVFRNEIFPDSSPTSRGADLAVEAGCLACHSRGGHAGAPNPSDEESIEIRTVPSLTAERHTAEELRQWIANGISDAKKESAAGMAGRERKALQMPAFASRLSEGEIDDLAAYVASVQYRSHVSDEEVSEGERLARRFSCFSCHGELGQGRVGNPGGLKGYIPGFVGADFDALTRDGNRDDVREWIVNGVSEAFLDQSFLGFSPGEYFTERQVIDMPAYRRFLTDEQVEILTDYVLELNRLGKLDVEAWTSLPRSAVPESGAPLLAESEEEASEAGAVEGERPDEAAEASSGGGSAPHNRAPAADFTLFYQSRDILRRCLQCHGPSDQKSDYRMEVRADALRGGEISSFLETAAVVPGDPSRGLLMAFIQAEEEDSFNEIYPMPPKGERLTPEQIEVIRRWIAAGFHWPPGADLLPPEE